MPKIKKSVNSWQVSTAAEAIAAAQFARVGWDVSVQYGANQPEYDIVAVCGERMMKVSVKGSQDGSWGLTQSFLEKADYHSAADKWLAKHTKKTVFCFVQFASAAISELPRVYLATPSEGSDWLKASANGRGDTILKESHTWGKSAHAAGMTEQIPVGWQFSASRVDRLAKTIELVPAAIVG